MKPNEDRVNGDHFQKCYCRCFRLKKGNFSCEIQLLEVLQKSPAIPDLFCFLGLDFFNGFCLNENQIRENLFLRVYTC